MSEGFQAALVNYDEGILSDDKVLAGALWRRFFDRNCTARQLEVMVKYVRQSVSKHFKSELSYYLVKRIAVGQRYSDYYYLIFVLFLAMQKISCFNNKITQSISIS